MYFMTYFVNWYMMGMVYPDDDWDDSDLFVPAFLVTIASPLAILFHILVICYRHGKQYKDIKEERRRLKAERDGAMSDEQLERLGMR